MPQVSQAQDKGKAMKLLEKGDALLEKGDRYWAAKKPEKGIAAYEDALEAYNAAYKAFNSPKIYFPIAEAEQKLFLYLDAMAHYKAVLDETEDPEADLVRSVEDAISEVRKNLSGLSLKVEQDGATVIFDGKKLGKTPLDDTHYFGDGRHTFSVTLEGFTPKEETVETKRGEVLKRDISLESMAVVVKKKKDKKPVVTSGIAPNKTPMTISFAVAGGFLIGATFTAIQAKARHDRYQDETVPDADRETARDRGKTYRLFTDIFLGGAALAAGYGTYYYYSKYKPRKKEQSLASLWVTPYANGEGGGVAMGASF